MRRVLWLLLIVGVGALMLGGLLESGTTWAMVFRPEHGELACETVATPTGRVTHCSTVEETTLWQRLTTKYTYYTPGTGTVRTGR
jgi:hypothetical protein